MREGITPTRKEEPRTEPASVPLVPSSSIHAASGLASLATMRTDFAVVLTAALLLHTFWVRGFILFHEAFLNLLLNRL